MYIIICLKGWGKRWVWSHLRYREKRVWSSDRRGPGEDVWRGGIRGGEGAGGFQQNPHFQYRRECKCNQIHHSPYKCTYNPFIYLCSYHPQVQSTTGSTTIVLVCISSTTVQCKCILNMHTSVCIVDQNIKTYSIDLFHGDVLQTCKGDDRNFEFWNPSTGRRNALRDLTVSLALIP